MNLQQLKEVNIDKFIDCINYETTLTEIENYLFQNFDSKKKKEFLNLVLKNLNETIIEISKEKTFQFFKDIKPFNSNEIIGNDEDYIKLLIDSNTSKQRLVKQKILLLKETKEIKKSFKN